MKKLLLIMIVAAMLTAAMGVTYLNIKNRTPYEIQVRLESLDDGNVWYVSVPGANFPSDDVFKEIVIPAGWYKVRASYKAANGAIYPCYGEADDILWDEAKAERLMRFYKGKRSLPFKPDACYVPDATRVLWMQLMDKIVEYDYKHVGTYIY